MKNFFFNFFFEIFFLKIWNGGGDGGSDGESDGESEGGSDVGSDGGSDGESDGGGDGGSDGGSDGSDKVDQREVSIVRLGMLESSGLRRYSTLLVIRLFSRRLCLCHCLCIRLCLCICVPYSCLNSYFHKLSENVWVGRSGASRSGEKKKS